MSVISICQIDLRSILQSVISRFLYREDINNMCGANRYLNELFTEDWRYVYRICLHHQPHNCDGPSIVSYPNGKWVRTGKFHREGDQESLAYAGGSQQWYKEGKLHRDGDKPAKHYRNGHKEWWKEGRVYKVLYTFRP